MKCRIKETNRFFDFVGDHVHYLVEAEDSRRFIVSWVSFNNLCTIPAPHPLECMAFEADENWEVPRFDELACVYDLGPDKSLAAVCEELGFELEGES
ncbi:MAG: hypothetical protein UEP80_07675 [Senegalimassilia anaerobia]|nr:hypothetical protein [Senegalimassilia anaerobia]